MLHLLVPAADGPSSVLGRLRVGNFDRTSDLVQVFVIFRSSMSHDLDLVPPIETRDEVVVRPFVHSSGTRLDEVG